MEKRKSLLHREICLVFPRLKAFSTGRSLFMYLVWSTLVREAPLTEVIPWHLVRINNIQISIKGNSPILVT